MHAGLDNLIIVKIFKYISPKIKRQNAIFWYYSYMSTSKNMTEAQDGALDILKRTFGYAHFKDKQAEIIDSVIGGNDALVLMPTGGGKSMCYQIPALARAGTGIVISPLLSLMKNQVDLLNQNGIRAARLDSSQTTGQVAHINAELLAGAVDILYASPERVMTAGFMALIRTLMEGHGVALFAIDEAHCVSQWGHDFRPEYVRLGEFCEQFPAVPRIALTATADQIIRDEILAKLQLRDPQISVSSFDRANIRYIVREKARNPVGELDRFIKQNFAGECGIVYCRTRSSVEQTADKLVNLGYNALPYHAGLDRAIRIRHQERFQTEDDVIVVATIAFGMGIDKPNVRFVVHLNLPHSMEHYYQETGRAGRDGHPSAALLLYGIADLVKNEQMINQSEAPEPIKQRERSKLKALLGFAETPTCRRKVMLEYFGEQFDGSCNNCDNCMSPPKVVDATIAVQKILSCAIRTGELFGMGHVIDVLIGKETPKVSKFGHERLTTFNIGTEYSRAEWQSFARQIMANQLLATDDRGYGSLKVTERGRTMLRERTQIMLRAPQPSPPPSPEREKRATTKTATRGSADNPLNEAEQKLFEVLRAERFTIAKTKGVPAYIIFTNNTLTDMARQKPTTLDEMSAISGVGAHKLNLYGEHFLQLIQQHK